MSDDQPSSAGQAHLNAIEQGLMDQQIFQVAVRKTRMAMALSDPNRPDCPLVYVNPSFCHLTGYTAEDAVGRNCRFLQGPNTDPEVVGRIRRAVGAHEPFGEEIYNYRKDGSGFWNALYLSPIFDEDGKLTYYFANQFDISVKREAMRRQAHRMQSMGALVSGVAHEFNNLMTVVMGSIERAAGADDTPEARHMRHASWAAERAGHLAAELMSLARRQSRGDRTVDLNEALRTFEATMAEVAGPGVRMRLALASDVVTAQLDGDQLELVLLNLVRNATDAMGGHGEIVVATRALSRLEAETALSGSVAVELSVADTGPGMPPEVLARATELFFTTKEPGKGTGLGLFLALEFVDQSSGRLAIDSKPDQGTVVRMVFPQAMG